MQRSCARLACLVAWLGVVVASACDSGKTETPAALPLLATIDLPAQGMQLAIDPLRQRIYVAISAPGKPGNGIVVIDGRDNSLLAQVESDVFPTQGMVLDATADHIYCVGSLGIKSAVAIYQGSTLKLLDVIELPELPVFVGLDEVTHRVHLGSDMVLDGVTGMLTATVHGLDPTLFEVIDAGRRRIYRIDAQTRRLFTAMDADTLASIYTTQIEGAVSTMSVDGVTNRIYFWMDNQRFTELDGSNFLVYPSVQAPDFLVDANRKPISAYTHTQMAVDSQRHRVYQVQFPIGEAVSRIVAIDETTDHASATAPSDGEFRSIAIDESTDRVYVLENDNSPEYLSHLLILDGRHFP